MRFVHAMCGWSFSTACFCFPRWHRGPSVARHFVILNWACDWFWWGGQAWENQPQRCVSALCWKWEPVSFALQLVLWVLGWEAGPAKAVSNGSDRCSSSGEPGRALPPPPLHRPCAVLPGALDAGSAGPPWGAPSWPGRLWEMVREKVWGQLLKMRSSRWAP